MDKENWVFVEKYPYFMRKDNPYAKYTMYITFASKCWRWPVHVQPMHNSGSLMTENHSSATKVLKSRWCIGVLVYWKGKKQRNLVNINKASSHWPNLHALQTDMYTLYWLVYNTLHWNLGTCVYALLPCTGGRIISQENLNPIKPGMQKSQFVITCNNLFETSKPIDKILLTQTLS